MKFFRELSAIALASDATHKGKNLTLRKFFLATASKCVGSGLSVGAIALGTISPAAAQQAITGLNTTTQTATSSSYSTTSTNPCTLPAGYTCGNNITLTFGVSNNLKLTGFVATQNYSILKLVDTIKLQRRDNANATGNKQVVFFEYNNTTIENLKPSAATTMDDILLDEIINRGADNVFANQGNGVGNNNNIERIDFLISGGLSVPSNSSTSVGFLILDRGGNDSFRIAAITSVDASGNPNGFGSLVRVNSGVTPSPWGRVGPSINTTVMRREQTETNFRPSAQTTNQNISGIYFSLSSLGVNAGETIYGYALFADDIDSSYNLVNYNSFPTTTSEASTGGGGLDLMAGGGIFTQNGLQSISGTLYRDNNSNQTFNVGEPPIANITVRLLDSTGTNVLATTTTNASGQYSFVGVTSGDYIVQVDTSDSDIPAGWALDTPNNLAVNVASSPVTGKDFGFELTPALTVTKTTSTPIVAAGSTATYTITVANAAGRATASNVNISDTLPSGLTYASTGTVTLSGGATRPSTTNPTTGATNPSWGSFTIPAGGSVSITFTVSFGLGVIAGTYQNPATANYNTPSGASGSSSYNSASSTGEDVVVSAVVGQSFACDGRFYQVRVVGSGLSAHSELYRIDRIPDPYQHTLILNPTPAVKLNALGHNPVDGYLYAIEYGTAGTNKLYRLTQSNATFIGNVSNLPVGPYSAGTFDAVGNYYVVPDNDSTKIYQVDVNAKTATAINLSAPMSVGDIAFNPIDGKMYGVLSGNLYQITISGSSANVSVVGSTGIPSETPIGSVFFDASGTFYGYSSFGYFYQIDLTNGTATEISNTVSASQSDGSSCPFTPQKLDVVKSAGTVTTVNNTTFDIPYTIAVKNTGTEAASKVQITENLNLTFNAGNPTITIQTAPVLGAGSGTLTLNPSFNGTSDFKLLAGTDTLAPGQERTITFTVRLTYPNTASVPSNTVQENTAYASSISANVANPGFTFAGVNSDIPIPPPDLLTSDLSTDSPTLPVAPHGDMPTPTPITLPFISNPNVLLVKRITKINNDTTSLNGDDLFSYFDDLSNPYDDNDITLANPVPPEQPDTDKWLDADNNGQPDDFLIGGIDGGQVKPGDEVEYTIYYLSAGNNTAQNVLFCDRVPANMSFLATGFDSYPVQASGGLQGVARGILWQYNGTTESLTNVSDGDTAVYFPPGVEPSSVYPNVNCQGSNTNGAIVVNLGNLPNATAPGIPANAYGFVRFKAKLN